MNDRTLKLLNRNPHYKMSPKQLEEKYKIEKKPMVGFGTHNAIGDTHNNSQVKKR